MINIETIHNNITNCFIPICTENAISMYLQYYNIEYETIFALAMRFHFNVNQCRNNRVADGLMIQYSCLELLEDMYNIKVKVKEFFFFHNLVRYIKRNIVKKKPLIIHMDSFYLRWSTLYQKEHTTHLVVVVDIDENNKDIVILDPIDKQEPVAVSFDILRDACKFLWDISIPKNPLKINQRKIDKGILEERIKVIEDNRFKEMASFTNAFLHMFSPNIEFRKCNDYILMMTEKLVDDIRKIIKGIDLFTVWLMWRNEQSEINQFVEAIEKYKQVMSKWNVFINNLYKRSMVGWEENFNEKGYGMLKEIVALEMEAYSVFGKCLEISDQSIGQTEEKIQKKKSYPCCLQKYVNNRGFHYDIIQNNECDLTGVGEYFVIDSGIQKKFTYKEILFEFNWNQKFDNLICQGQEIEITEKFNISGIAFICCAEWGAVDEKIEIKGAGKERILLNVHIHDISQYEEKDACIIGKTYDMQGNNIQKKSALFVQVHHFEKCRIDKIILPNSNNVHILAITLLKDQEADRDEVE